MDFLESGGESGWASRCQEDNGCDTSQNVLVVVTGVAICLGWGFFWVKIQILLKPNFVEQGYQGRIYSWMLRNNSGSVRDAVLSAIQRNIKNIYNTVVFDCVSSEFTKSYVMKQKQSKLPTKAEWLFLERGIYSW